MPNNPRAADNLIPFVPGQSGNPKGKKPGTLNLSTMIKKMAADGKLAEAMFKRKPSWWDSLEDKNMAGAIVGAMMMRAAGGDTKAATWFRKSGWGDKLDITSDDRPIIPLMVLDMSPPKPKPSSKAKPKPRKVKTNAGNKPKAKPGLRASKKPKNSKA